jgi:hypothetical protein
MFGAGLFKNRVNNNDVNLSLALDAIPPTGEVLQEYYSQFVSYFARAFPTGLGHGLGTATRLLALKRPDYFVCFDSANRAGLCKAFDITLGHHDYERYWASIVERVVLSTWWNSPRPKNVKEMKVWDGRVAFLDSFYYLGSPGRRRCNGSGGHRDAVGNGLALTWSAARLRPSFRLRVAPDRIKCADDDAVSKSADDAPRRCVSGFFCPPADRSRVHGARRVRQ